MTWGTRFAPACRGLEAEEEAGCWLGGVGTLAVGEVVFVEVGRAEVDLAKLGPETEVLAEDGVFDAHCVVDSAANLILHALAASGCGAEGDESAACADEGMQAEVVGHVADVADGVFGDLGLDADDVGNLGGGSAAGVVDGEVVNVAGVAVVVLEDDFG